MIPVLASSPLLLSFVQEESNIRNMQTGKYMVRVLSDEPDELCTGVVEENPWMNYGVKISLLYQDV